MEDVPKLHGWITPEYAVEMIQDLYRYLLRVESFQQHTQELSNHAI